MVFLKWSCFLLLLCSYSYAEECGECVEAQEEECQPECQQRHRCCRRRYNPEEEELYERRSEVLYPSKREGMFEQLTHQ